MRKNYSIGLFTYSILNQVPAVLIAGVAVSVLFGLLGQMTWFFLFSLVVLFLILPVVEGLWAYLARGFFVRAILAKRAGLRQQNFRQSSAVASGVWMIQ